MEDIFDLDDREDLPNEDIFDCYACNWTGENPCKSDLSGLFEKIDGEDEIFCCPVCGGLLE